MRTYSGVAGTAASAEEFLAQEPPPGEEQFEHRRGPLVARAGLTRVAAAPTSGVAPRDEPGPLWVLIGLSAAPGRMAECTITFRDERDRHFALETWRSIGCR